MHEKLEDLADELSKEGMILQRGGTEIGVLSFNRQGTQYELLASFHFDPLRETRVLREHNGVSSILTIGFERNYSMGLHDEMIEKLKFLRRKPSDTFITDVGDFLRSEIEVYEECRADSKSADLDFGKVLSSSRYTRFLHHFRKIPMEEVFSIARKTFHVEYP